MCQRASFTYVSILHPLPGHRACAVMLLGSLRVFQIRVFAAEYVMSNVKNWDVRRLKNFTGTVSIIQ